MTTLRLAAALTAFCATTALAQPANTGANAAGSGAVDPSWEVEYSGPTNGSGQAVRVADGSLPSPPWASNGPDSYWISVMSNASLPQGTGNNAELYNYTFSHSFTGTGSPMYMTIWTDNFFKGFKLNADLYMLDAGDVAPAPGDFNQPAPRVFTLNTTVGANTLEIYITGDGQTDAINASFTATPEPGTVALLATGLLGLGGFGLSRRRRVTG